ncbi:MAG: hypothetical protein JXR95_06650 [Deltaproteobacteria bacterium]|nr:hypothetical protein [Deltaproteobacteria bacterium]
MNKDYEKFQEALQQREISFDWDSKVASKVIKVKKRQRTVVVAGTFAGLVLFTASALFFSDSVLRKNSAEITEIPRMEIASIEGVFSRTSEYLNPVIGGVEFSTDDELLFTDDGVDDLISDTLAQR